GRRGAGSRRPTPTSSTSTRSTRAATSPPGKSPSCSRPKSGPRSAPCASWRGDGGHDVCPPSHTTEETTSLLVDRSTIPLTGWSTLVQERNTHVSDNFYQCWPSDRRA